jgi:hypothetical protein
MESAVAVHEDNVAAEIATGQTTVGLLSELAGVLDFIKTKDTK